MLLNKQKLTIVVGFFLFVSAFGCEKLSSSQTNNSSNQKVKPIPSSAAMQKPTAAAQAVVMPKKTEEKKATPKPEAPKASEPAPAAKIPENVLAKVGSWTITVEEFKERLAALKEVVPEYDPTNIDQNKLILEELIRQELIVQDAIKTGLAGNEDIVKAVEEFKKTLLVREVANKLTKDIDVTEEEAKEYYEANKEDFTEEAQWRVREIVVDTEEEAKQILVELYQGADFAEKVKEKSKSNSVWQKGDLGLKAKFDFPTMQKVAESLDVGNVSGVFSGPEGYYIIKLEEKQGGEAQAFEEIKEDIVGGLTLLKQQQAILEHLDKLRQQTDIQVNLNLLEE